MPSRAFYFLLLASMNSLPIRIDHRGICVPLVSRFTSKHRNDKFTVRTAKRRQQKTGFPMGIVTWHDANFVVMPAWMARHYDEEELLVEYV